MSGEPTRYREVVLTSWDRGVGKANAPLPDISQPALSRFCFQSLS